jgi:hypothetical protein
MKKGGIDISYKVKLYRKLTKRPYGLAKFRVGRTWYSKMVRFGNDSIIWHGGKYMFVKQTVIIEKGAGNRKVYNMNEWADYEEGYPVIYFDVNNAIPLHFEGDMIDKLPTPRAIQSTIKKEIASFEAEVMRKTRSKLMLLALFTMIMVLINIVIAYYTLQKVGEIAPQVSSNVNAAIQNYIAMQHNATAGVTP